MEMMTTTSNNTAFDSIYAYYFANKKKKVKLTPKEEEIRQRWEQVWHLACGFQSKVSIANYLQRTYGLCKAQAYSDIKNAENLFGSDPNFNNKNAKREMLSAWIEQAIEKIWERSDGEEASKSFEVLSKYFMRYAKLHKLEEDDQGQAAEMLRKIKPHTIVFSADPETLKKQSEELIKDVQDVDYEDVTHEPGAGA